MAIIRRIQWLISLSVLACGVALISVLGVTALLVVGVGLIYCALAAWAARMTIVPLSFAAIANGALGWMAWRWWVSSLASAPANAQFQANYLSLELIASSVVLLLIAWYVVAVILKWKQLGRQKWL